MVCYIWWEHNKFFRRYGLQDAWTAFLNSVLLFVVLFYVYPLKYLTIAVLGQLFGLPHPASSATRRYVMLLYSTGIVLIFGTFVLLYRARLAPAATRSTLDRPTSFSCEWACARSSSARRSARVDRARAGRCKTQMMWARRRALRADGAAARVERLLRPGAARAQAQRRAQPGHGSDRCETPKSSASGRSCARSSRGATGVTIHELATHRARSRRARSAAICRRCRKPASRSTTRATRTRPSAGGSTRSRSAPCRKGCRSSDVAALYLSRSVVESLSGWPLADELRAAFAKIERALNPRMREFLATLPQVISTKAGPRAHEASAHARRRHAPPVRRRARSPRRRDAVLLGRQQPREVVRRRSPYRLTLAQGGVYLVAWVPQYDEFRTFAVERIERLSVTDDTFRERASCRPICSALDGRLLGRAGADRARVRRRASRRTSRGRVWHESQQLDELRGRPAADDARRLERLGAAQLALGFGRRARDAARLARLGAGRRAAARARAVRKIKSVDSRRRRRTRRSDVGLEAKSDVDLRIRSTCRLPVLGPTCQSSWLDAYSARPSCLSSVRIAASSCASLPAKRLADRPRDRDVHLPRVALHVAAVGGPDAHARQAQRRSVDERRVPRVDDPAGGRLADDRARA